MRTGPARWGKHMKSLEVLGVVSVVMVICLTVVVVSGRSVESLITFFGLMFASLTTYFVQSAKIDRLGEKIEKNGNGHGD